MTHEREGRGGEARKRVKVKFECLGSYKVRHPSIQPPQHGDVGCDDVINQSIGRHSIGWLEAGRPHHHHVVMSDVMTSSLAPAGAW